MTLRELSDGEEFWAGNDPDDEIEMTMDENELLLDTTDEDDGTDDVEFYEELRFGCRPLSARRRIEISREERWLKSALADFEEYYGIEDFDDHYVERSSY